MCRVLVRYVDKRRTIDDDDKCERAHTVKGDPIVVQPDGHEWGREEGLPTYVSLDMDGVPVKEIKKYTNVEFSPILNEQGKRFIQKKRAYTIQLDELPLVIRDGLKRDGKAQVSLADIKGRILNKISGTRQ
jgi:hypothetical protein